MPKYRKLIVLFLAAFLRRTLLLSFFQVALGYEKHYNVQNPFEWMELISLQVRSSLLPSLPLSLSPFLPPPSMMEQIQLCRVKTKSGRNLRAGVMGHPNKVSLVPPSLPPSLPPSIPPSLPPPLPPLSMSGQDQFLREARGGVPESGGDDVQIQQEWRRGRRRRFPDFQH